ncbi:hypothetical protein UO65_0770 [Actinokineospora spheciospongiae]|uniref:Uncharacterized protein n=1 Tax=Actinokineospora spheciospongiae TaxID=909613 RepID=W7ISN4_9PSEU|nr:hypothetical protein UO65_0770 [Actinokineospora spheciospongiae]
MGRTAVCLVGPGPPGGGVSRGGAEGARPQAARWSAARVARTTPRIGTSGVRLDSHLYSYARPPMR